MQFVNAKQSKGVRQNSKRFLAPGMIAIGRVSGLRTHHANEGSIGNANKVKRKYGTPKLLDLDEEFDQDIESGNLSGGLSSHILIMHFSGMDYRDKNFNEDTSFLDILSICKKFIDIYSTGIKITYGHGKPLRNDEDIMTMLKEHKGILNIHVYVKEDKTASHVGIMLPEDYYKTAPPLCSNLPIENPLISSDVASIPKVTNVKIMGDLKVNKKVVVHGLVTEGNEEASIVEWFITNSKTFDIETSLKSISISNTEKELVLPLEVASHYVVAKYTPMTTNGKSGSPVYAVSNTVIGNAEPTLNERNVRGKNKNKIIAALKPGEKLPIIFFNNRPVGENQRYWSRHLGRLVRDSNICHVQVQHWGDMTSEDLNFMWASVKECFDNPDIEFYRNHTLAHMGELWTNWRSTLYCKYVKPCTVAEAIKNVPEGLTEKDWKWLVMDKFLSKEFQKNSNQNSSNRNTSKMRMPHRTGSKPHRDLIYDMGGKDGNPPDSTKVFFVTRAKNGNLVDQETINKYDELVKVKQSNPTLDDIELIEQCLGAQSHSHVFCYGGGIKRKHLVDSNSSYVKKLEAKLIDKEEENHELKRRIDGIESRLEQMEKGNNQPCVASPTSNDGVHQVHDF